MEGRQSHLVGRQLDTFHHFELLLLQKVIIVERLEVQPMGEIVVKYFQVLLALTQSGVESAVRENTGCDEDHPGLCGR